VQKAANDEERLVARRSGKVLDEVLLDERSDPPTDEHPARRRRECAGQDAEQAQRCGRVRTRDGDSLTCAHLEADLLQRKAPPPDVRVLLLLVLLLVVLPDAAVGDRAEL